MEEPTLVTESMKAPLLSSSVITKACPSFAAKCNAFIPFCGIN